MVARKGWSSRMKVVFPSPDSPQIMIVMYRSCTPKLASSSGLQEPHKAGIPNTTFPTRDSYVASAACNVQHTNRREAHLPLRLDLGEPLKRATHVSHVGGRVRSATHVLLIKGGTAVATAVGSTLTAAAAIICTDIRSTRQPQPHPHQISLDEFDW